MGVTLLNSYVLGSFLLAANSNAELHIRVGTGGSVQSTDGTIDCFSNCSRLIDAEETVTLSPLAHPLYTFDHWEGACIGDALSCQVSTLNGTRSTVWAVFKPTHEVLTDIPFEDERLAECLAEAYTGDTPTADIYYVECNNRNITSLTGIEHLPALVKISVAGNQIRDLSPVANSILIEEINAAQNQIIDASVLFNLPVLSQLDLAENSVIDCESVQTMTEYLKSGRYTVSLHAPQCE